MRCDWNIIIFIQPAVQSGDIAHLTTELVYLMSDPQYVMFA